MSNPSLLPWYDPHWLKEAHQWIDGQARRHSIRITGAIEQPHVYAWSTVMRVPTSEGTLFFKATAEESLYEAALTEKLAAWFPDCMPELIAVDRSRGWMLMRDGGEQLRTRIRPMQNSQPWEPVIGRYAELQIELSEHIHELLALGVTDYRLAKLPALYSQLLAQEETLLIGQEKGLTSDEVRLLQDLNDRFTTICSDLAACGIPESLNHGDFHDGNVLIKDGRITFFDWGEASVTHPFVSLRTFFVSIEISLQLDDYSFTPEMSALLDRYLEPWQKFAAREDLLSAYQLSRPVAALVKASAWQETISRMDGSLRAEYAWIVPDVLREFMLYEKKLSDSMGK